MKAAISPPHPSAPTRASLGEVCERHRCLRGERKLISAFYGSSGSDIGVFGDRGLQAFYGTGDYRCLWGPGLQVFFGTGSDKGFYTDSKRRAGAHSQWLGQGHGVRECVSISLFDRGMLQLHACLGLRQPLRRVGWIWRRYRSVFFSLNFDFQINDRFFLCKLLVERHLPL